MRCMAGGRWVGEAGGTHRRHYLSVTQSHPIGRHQAQIPSPPSPQYRIQLMDICSNAVSYSFIITLQRYLLPVATCAASILFPQVSRLQYRTDIFYCMPSVMFLLRHNTMQSHTSIPTFADVMFECLPIHHACQIRSHRSSGAIQPFYENYFHLKQHCACSIHLYVCIVCLIASVNVALLVVICIGRLKVISVLWGF